MSLQRNPNDGNIKQILKRIRKLEHAAPMNNAAIGRDGLLVYDGGVITIENGGLDVTGSATISGVLNVSGTTTLSGATTIAGPTGITGALTIAGQLDVTGPTTLAGTLDITGDTTVTGLLDIEGDTTLTGNMDVLGGGKITVGNTILSPSASNGGVEFASGGGIGGNAGGVVMRGSANAGFMALSNTTAALFAGASQITLTEANTIISNRLTVNGSIETKQNLVVRGGTVILENLPTTAQPANLYVNASGYLYRSTV